MRNRKTEPTEKLAKTLYEIRRQAKLSQDKAAAMLSVSPLTYRNWESAKAMPKEPDELLAYFRYEVKMMKSKTRRFRKPRIRNTELIDFVIFMRTAVGMSAAELAEEMGEKPCNLLALESGDKEPLHQDEFVQRVRTIIKAEIKRQRERR